MVIGKLPFHGDFVARGVTGRERDLLDKWLATSMAIASEQLGEKFDEAFDAAPPWRFAWDEDGWTAGALVPSVELQRKAISFIGGAPKSARGTSRDRFHAL